MDHSDTLPHLTQCGNENDGVERQAEVCKSPDLAAKELEAAQNLLLPVQPNEIREIHVRCNRF